MSKKIVLNSSEIEAVLKKMAETILAAHPQNESLCLVGIRTGGAFLARRLEAILNELSGSQVPTGIIDISLYRDDWTSIASKPIVGKTELDFSMDGRYVILVDDVLYTGRTIRAALDALIDFGRPAKIELAVLVDRGHRELPIHSDYTGVSIRTELSERVNVYLSETGSKDEVVVEQH